MNWNAMTWSGHMICSLLLSALLGWVGVTWGTHPAFGAEPTVVVYGATPAGIAAALAAAEDGETVLLVEPNARIGGLVTSGLSHTDLRTFESLTGTFLDFTRRVEAHYRETNGADSAQVKACERGIFGEPSVNLLVFERMLASQPRVEVVRRTQLNAVTMRDMRTDQTNANNAALRTLTAASFIGADGAKRTVAARVFIDATYEGDLMAAAGVKWRAGREARGEFGESLAPETADSQLQAYNFRFMMTRSPENRVTPTAPTGYRREDFLPLLPVLSSGQIQRVFGYPSKCLFKAQEPPLPNGKYDINDVSGGLVRLSLPGRNGEWPDGDSATRARIFAEHLRDQVGLLYFLQNDDAVPSKYRDEAREWGWCRDEFIDSQHLPPQVYVREARRMIGRYVFTERDTDHAKGDARAVLRTDAIAMGDYGPNCHGTAHEGPRFGGRHTGEFYKPVVPYQVPYGVLVPRDVDNLLVACAVSSSHVGFCALRLEPIWTSLGLASGHAAHLAVVQKCAVADVSLNRLQSRLHARGSATIYISDIPPGTADFAAVQWWGLHGGWHGLALHPGKSGQRGRNLHGQYFAAFPLHAAELDKPLDETTAKHWTEIATRLGLKSDSAQRPLKSLSRGEFLRDCWRKLEDGAFKAH